MRLGFNGERLQTPSISISSTHTPPPLLMNPQPVSSPPSSLTTSRRSPGFTVDKVGEIAQRWMEMVLGETLTQGFPMALMSGEWLCALANKLFQALGMKEHHCEVIKTSWPHVSSNNTISTQYASENEQSQVDRHDAGSCGDVWMQQKQCARNNITSYLNACISIGVPTDDCFQVDDLLELINLDKVYENLICLQTVALSLSRRRSIDTRSSLDTFKPSVSASPVLSLLGASDDLVSPHNRSSLDNLTSISWEVLLNTYEAQQNQNVGVDRDAEGLGKVAYDIWMTEEKIRALLIRDVDTNLVPDHLHGKLWLLASGASIEMRRQKGQYEQFVALETIESTDATRQIDADLHRTISETDKASWTEVQTNMLRRVLVAYSYYNPTLGYCQGLNYIVARLLQFVEEEEAFYLLIKLIKLVPDDYYTTMLGLAVDQHVFADLVRLQTPGIAELLGELGGSGMELSLACTEWFLTLFASPCEKEVTVRIWDCIFLLGDEVLFRVALALMKSENDKLLTCNSYGDMLKQLNAIGRENTDATRLMKDSQQQELVIRARIEDLRAIHRLQLAAGIAGEALDGDLSTSPTDQNSQTTHGDKDDGKGKFFSLKKRQGLFKHVDKNAGRVHRTFDRFLTHEYESALQKEHPTFSCFYDGQAPTIVDEYWSCKNVAISWGTNDYRQIIEDAKDMIDPHQLLSNDTLFNSREYRRRSDSQRMTSSKNVGRVRRSKSSAFVHFNPEQGVHRRQTQHYRGIPISGYSEESNMDLPRGHHYGKKVDDEFQLNRSPKGWLQRIEVWHKEFKLLKEKKKSEKRKHKSFTGDQNLRVNQTFSSSPPWQRPSQSNFDLPRGISFDSQALFHTAPQNEEGGSVTRNDKRRDSLDVHVGRSLSDPFLSSGSNNSPGQYQSERRPRRILDDRDPSCNGNDQDSTSFIQQTSAPSTFSPEPSQQTIEISSSNHENVVEVVPPHKTAIPFEPPKRLSIVHSFSSPALAALGDIKDKRDYDAAIFSSLDGTSNRRTSVRGSRHKDESEGLTFARRRNQSLSLADVHQMQLHSLHHHLPHPRFPRKVVDSTRIMRERAQVLSYLQRKASDASSIAENFPRTPRDRSEASIDSNRHSISSNGSSHFGEGSNRSLKTTVNSNSQYSASGTSSFSFFDKLSIDTESHLGGLKRSFKEEPPIRTPGNSSRHNHEDLVHFKAETTED